jgi:hypothetical protein
VRIVSRLKRKSGDGWASADEEIDDRQGSSY